MKLIELLKQELPKRGGWPDGKTHAWQDHNTEARFAPEVDADFFPQNKFLCELYRDIGVYDITPNHQIAVTHEQYEAALAAAQPQWDGDGIPPVGCECEVKYRHGGTDWSNFKCLAVDRDIAFGWCADEPVTLPNDCYEFRPIRSEADKKREEVGLALYHAINWNAEGELVSPSRMEDYKKAYDAIAAGKIPGLRIE